MIGSCLSADVKLKADVKQSKVKVKKNCYVAVSYIFCNKYREPLKLQIQCVKQTCNFSFNFAWDSIQRGLVC